MGRREERKSYELNEGKSQRRVELERDSDSACCWIDSW